MHWVIWNAAVPCCSAHRECSVKVGNRIEWTNSFSGLPRLHTLLFSHTPPSPHPALGSEDPSCSYRVSAVLSSIRRHFLLCQVHPRGLTFSISLLLPVLIFPFRLHGDSPPRLACIPDSARDSELGWVHLSSEALVPAALSPPPGGESTLLYSLFFF